MTSSFSSIPAHPDTQPIFTFSFFAPLKGRNLHFIDSPAACSAVVIATLVSFAPPLGCSLIQYVDDLLLTAETYELYESLNDAVCNTWLSVDTKPHCQSYNGANRKCSTFVVKRSTLVVC